MEPDGDLIKVDTPWEGNLTFKKSNPLLIPYSAMGGGGGVRERILVLIDALVHSKTYGSFKALCELLLLSSVVIQTSLEE